LGLDNIQGIQINLSDLDIKSQGHIYIVMSFLYLTLHPVLEHLHTKYEGPGTKSYKKFAHYSPC